MGKVGPHEGVEFELFAKGGKDIILFFNDGLPESVHQLAQAVGAKELVFSAGKLFADSEIELIGFIYYRCGHEQQAERLASLVLDSLNQPTEPFLIEREIGRLLGYAEDDIDVYVQRLNRRL